MKNGVFLAGFLIQLNRAPALDVVDPRVDGLEAPTLQQWIRTWQRRRGFSPVGEPRPGRVSDGAEAVGHLQRGQGHYHKEGHFAGNGGTCVLSIYLGTRPGEIIPFHCPIHCGPPHGSESEH